MQAIWKDQVIAESDDTIKLEGNYYFPEASLKKEFFERSNMHTICPWKGKASYYHLRQDTAVNRNAAWYYPEPSPAAMNIKDRVGFGAGITIKE
jgi:uncharacterized protein (DUF427 family)